MKKTKRLISLLCAFSAVAMASCGEKPAESSQQPASSSSSFSSKSEEDKVAKVVEAIDALNDESTADEVESARALYDALSEEDKKMVGHEVLNKLLAQEKRIADLKAADPVMKLIAALNENSTDEEIAHAREEYEKLSDDQKLKVSNYARLVSIETHAKNLKLAKEFENRIDALGENPAIKDIVSIVYDYSNLDDGVKELIDKEKVEKMQAFYKNKEAEIKAINDAIALVEVLTDSSSKGEVQSAKNAYDALSQEQKDCVPSSVCEKLTKQVNRISSIQEAADVIINAINALPDAFSSDEQVVVNLRQIRSIATLIEDFVKLHGEGNRDDFITNLSKFDSLKEIADRYDYVYKDDGSNGLTNSSTDAGYSRPNKSGKEVDSTYGGVFTCELDQGNGGIEIRIQNDASFSYCESFDYYFFYLYNPTSKTFSMNISRASSWSGLLLAKELVPGWNKVEISTSILSKEYSFRYLNTTDPANPTYLTDVSGTWKMSYVYAASDGFCLAQKEADKVDEKIALLTDESPEADVVDARASYEALTAEEKNFVTELDALVAQENRIKLSKIGKRAQNIIDKIDALPAFSASDIGVLPILGKIDELTILINAFAADFGQEAVGQYITNYSTYEAALSATNGYSVIYGDGEGHGMTYKAGEVDVGAGYCCSINSATSFDNAYGGIFTCELCSGNGRIEIRIGEDARFDDPSQYEYFYFYFYNPTTTTIPFHLSKQSCWAGTFDTVSVAPGWNKITIDSATASSVVALRYLHAVDTVVNDVSGTWKMTYVIGAKAK